MELNPGHDCRAGWPTDLDFSPKFDLDVTWINKIQAHIKNFSKQRIRAT